MPNTSSMFFFSTHRQGKSVPIKCAMKAFQNSEPNHIQGKGCTHIFFSNNMFSCEIKHVCKSSSNLRMLYLGELETCSVMLPRAL
jgi:hypothetical protein